jgi:uncharacterized protein YkwD
MNMSKKALSIIVLLGIVLSACGGQAAQATETPTAIPETATEVPATNTAVEETIPVTGDEATATAIPSPTATVFVPENAADCTNLASFVSDVTIPDNSTVNAGASFTKTWRVQNAGTCIWWAGYTLTHYSENAMSAPDTVPLPVTNPGETADISVDLIAPSVAGTYRGNFVIENPEGLIMQVDEDSRLWLIINVTGSATSAPTGTPGSSSSSSGASGTAAPTTASSSAGSSGATCAFTTDAGRTNAVVSALNAYRAQNGLAAQPVNARLSQAAQAHANDMACNNLFVHTGSDGSTPETRVAAAGYTASDVSENVYGSYPPLTGEGAVNWWAADKTDPRHNENLLTTKYTEIGVGYAFFENFGYYVIVFATP